MDTRHFKKVSFIGFLGLVAAIVFFFSAKNSKDIPPGNDTKLSFVYEDVEKNRDTVPKLKSPKLKAWPLTPLSPRTDILSDNKGITGSDVKNFFSKKLDVFQNQGQDNSSYFKQNLNNIQENVLKLSDSEIFEKMWPSVYRSDLRKFEEFMMQDGFINSSERSPMLSDEDMFDFYKTMLNYAHSKQWVSEENYHNLLRGVTEILPNVLGLEKAILRGERGGSSFLLPGGQRMAQDKSDTLVSNIIEGLKYVFSFAEPANAAWYRDIDCYKDDIFPYPIPGPNLYSFCCNCGFYFVPAGTKCVPIYESDCGEFNETCIEKSKCAPPLPLGCLNLACAAWPNAIWDPLTGICGCG